MDDVEKQNIIFYHSKVAIDESEIKKNIVQ